MSASFHHVHTEANVLPDGLARKGVFCSFVSFNFTSGLVLLCIFVLLFFSFFGEIKFLQL